MNTPTGNSDESCRPMPMHPTASEPASEQAWFKSSYSVSGQNCIEAAHLTPTAMAVRDSKSPAGPALLLPATAWAPFLSHLREPGSRD
ncbi:DUF397 domain-containing protein [Streptomyces galilaeus]